MSVPANGTVVVAGASLAGLHAALELRARGFDGRVIMVGDERHLPYDRPPLSKKALTREWTEETRPLVPAHPDPGLSWRLGCRASGLDLHRKEVALSDGERIRFDGLVIATGARPRRLPLNDGRQVHVLRTREDADALRADLDRSPSRVAIVGGGFIGAEVAATCRARGVRVTVVEPLSGPLARALGDDMASVFGRFHQDHGVDMRTGVAASAAVLDGGNRVQALTLSDGSRVEADIVVVAVGVVPETDWLVGSGLTVDDGLCCDESCLAAPDVVAAGDVARWPNRRFDETRRVEHWDNAVQQGRHAARRLLLDDGDRPAAYRPVPYVWSDQYDRTLQLYGSTAGHDEVRTVDGGPEEMRFVALYRRGDRLSAVLGVNRTRSLLVYRRKLEDGCSWDDAISQRAS